VSPKCGTMAFAIRYKSAVPALLDPPPPCRMIAPAAGVQRDNLWRLAKSRADFRRHPAGRERLGYDPAVPRARGMS
jgi:hypothetical protein